MVAGRICPIGATAVRVPPGWRGLLALVLLVAVGVPLGAQPRQEQDLVRRPGKPDIDTTVTQPKRVQVVDDQNRPLADAQVRVGWWEDEDGDAAEMVVEELRSTPLAAGLHFLQLQIQDAQGEEGRSIVVVRTESEKPKDWPRYTVPRLSADQSRSVPEGLVLRAAASEIDLLLRPTADDDVWLAWRLTAQ